MYMYDCKAQTANMEYICKNNCNGATEKIQSRISQPATARDNSYIILTYQKEIKMCLN